MHVEISLIFGITCILACNYSTIFNEIQSLTTRFIVLLFKFRDRVSIDGDAYEIRWWYIALLGWLQTYRWALSGEWWLKLDLLSYFYFQFMAWTRV